MKNKARKLTTSPFFLQSQQYLEPVEHVDIKYYMNIFNSNSRRRYKALTPCHCEARSNEATQARSKDHMKTAFKHYLLLALTISGLSCCQQLLGRNSVASKVSDQSINPMIELTKKQKNLARLNKRGNGMDADAVTQKKTKQTLAEEKQDRELTEIESTAVRLTASILVTTQQYRESLTAEQITQWQKKLAQLKAKLAAWEIDAPEGEQRGKIAETKLAQLSEVLENAILSSQGMLKKKDFENIKAILRAELDDLRAASTEGNAKRIELALKSAKKSVAECKKDIASVDSKYLNNKDKTAREEAQGVLAQLEAEILAITTREKVRKSVESQTASLESDVREIRNKIDRLHAKIGAQAYSLDKVESKRNEINRDIDKFEQKLNKDTSLPYKARIAQMRAELRSLDVSTVKNEKVDFSQVFSFRAKGLRPDAKNLQAELTKLAQEQAIASSKTARQAFRPATRNAKFYSTASSKILKRARDLEARIADALREKYITTPEEDSLARNLYEQIFWPLGLEFTELKAISDRPDTRAAAQPRRSLPAPMPQQAPAQVMQPTQQPRQSTAAPLPRLPYTYGNTINSAPMTQQPQTALPATLQQEQAPAAEAARMQARQQQPVVYTAYPTQQNGYAQVPGQMGF